MGAIVLDVETTGVNPHVDRVIEIAVVDYETEAELIHTRLDPDCLITEEITRITGITSEMLIGKPKFADIAERVAQVIEGAEAIIGYNPFFDRGMISSELSRCKISVKWPIMVCGLRLWNIHEPREKRDLTNAYRRFVSRNDTTFEGAHGALNDTIATLKVIREQFAEFELHGKRWIELDPEQTEWCGGSNHLIWRDDTIVVNFGKHKGEQMHAVDRGFWRWVHGKDFPEHVLVLCDYILACPMGRPTAQELASWARKKGL